MKSKPYKDPESCQGAWAAWSQAGRCIPDGLPACLPWSWGQLELPRGLRATVQMGGTRLRITVAGSELKGIGLLLCVEHLDIVFQAIKNTILLKQPIHFFKKSIWRTIPGQEVTPNRFKLLVYMI